MNRATVFIGFRVFEADRLAADGTDREDWWSLVRWNIRENSLNSEIIKREPIR